MTAEEAEAEGEGDEIGTGKYEVWREVNILERMKWKEDTGTGK